MNQSNVIQQENQLKAIDEFALNPESIKAMVKEYQNLEVIPGDKKSYKIVHEAKMILTKARTGTDKKRKELGSEARSWINDVNSAAKELIAPLLPLEEKLKSMLDTEDSREEKIEQARIEKIDMLISGLTDNIAIGMKYNTDAYSIQNHIDTLTEFEISSVDFEEKTEQAEQIKAEGLEALGRILADRVKHEETQANQAAEAEKLAADRAEFEAARLEERKKQDALQAKLEEERRVKDLEAKKIADEQAEKLRLQQEQIDRDRKIIDDQKREQIAQTMADALVKYSNEFDEAVRLNLAIVNDTALEENTAFEYKRADDEKIRKENQKYDSARQELIKSDQKKIQKFIDHIDEVVFNLEISLATEDGGLVIKVLNYAIKSALDVAEAAGCNLE
jgi:hypothetical protein